MCQWLICCAIKIGKSLLLLSMLPCHHPFQLIFYQPMSEFVSICIRPYPFAEMPWWPECPLPEKWKKKRQSRHTWSRKECMAVGDPRALLEDSDLKALNLPVLITSLDRYCPEAEQEDSRALRTSLCVCSPTCMFLPDLWLTPYSWAHGHLPHPPFLHLHDGNGGHRCPWHTEVGTGLKAILLSTECYKNK